MSSFPHSCETGQTHNITHALLRNRSSEEGPDKLEAASGM